MTLPRVHRQPTGAETGLTPLTRGTRYLYVVAGLAGLAVGAAFIFLAIDSLTTRSVVGSQEIRPLAFLFGFGSLVLAFSGYVLALIRRAPKAPPS